MKNIVQRVARMARHSLFCALRPPRELAREVWDEFDWLEPGDDHVETERMHVTLALLGAWARHPGDVINEVRDVCESLRADPFRIVFDELIVGDRILWRPSEAIPALDRFQKLLTGGLADAGLPVQAARGFSPHMHTSYRSRARGRPFMVPVSWVVRDFVLIESLVGQRTQIERGRWKLGNSR